MLLEKLKIVFYTSLSSSLAPVSLGNIAAYSFSPSNLSSDFRVYFPRRSSRLYKMFCRLLFRFRQNLQAACGDISETQKIAFHLSVPRIARLVLAPSIGRFPLSAAVKFRHICGGIQPLELVSETAARTCLDFCRANPIPKDCNLTLRPRNTRNVWRLCPQKKLLPFLFFRAKVSLCKNPVPFGVPSRKFFRTRKSDSRLAIENALVKLWFQMQKISFCLIFNVCNHVNSAVPIFFRTCLPHDKFFPFVDDRNDGNTDVVFISRKRLAYYAVKLSVPIRIEISLFPRQDGEAEENNLPFLRADQNFSICNTLSLKFFFFSSASCRNKSTLLFRHGLVRFCRRRKKLIVQRNKETPLRFIATRTRVKIRLTFVPAFSKRSGCIIDMSAVHKLRERIVFCKVDRQRPKAFFSLIRVLILDILSLSLFALRR